MKRIILAACLAFAFAASSPQAQDAVSPSSLAGATANVQALEQKVEHLSRLVRILEDQVNKCGEKAPAAPGEAEDAEDSISTNLPQPSQAHVPATRYGGGGFRMAPGQRLTCEDYSRSYFQRHPAVAKVCGITVNDDHTAEPAPAAVSVTTP